MAVPARGTSALLGVATEQPVPGLTSGIPSAPVGLVAAPTTPTAVAGSGTGITGSMTYAYAAVVPGRGEGTLSEASTACVVANKNITVTVVWPADAVLLRVYRKTGTGPWGLVKILWDDTSATFTDATAASGEDFTRQPLDVSGNLGLTLWPINSGAGFYREDATGSSPEITGSLAPPRKFAGVTTVPGDIFNDLRTASLVPLLDSLLFPGTVVKGAGPWWTVTWEGSLVDLYGSSLWGLFAEGGDIGGMFWQGARPSEIDIALPAGSQVASLKAKLMGIASTTVGAGVPATGNTYPYAPILRGAVGPTAYGKAIALKCTAAAANGVVKFKACYGDTPTWTGTEVSAHYDADTGVMIQGPASDEPGVELFDQNGLALGFDTELVREPLSFTLAGDLQDVALDSIWDFPAAVTIPGTGEDQTGEARRRLSSPRFGPATVRIFRGSTAADALLACEAGSVKLARTATPVRQFGPSARRAADVDVSGYLAIEVGATRRFTTNEFRRLQEDDGRFWLDVRIVGAPIEGTATHESISILARQVAVVDTKSPVAGASVTKENLKFAAEDPDSGAAPFTITVVTPWPLAETA